MAKVKKPDLSPIILVKYNSVEAAAMPVETIIELTHKRQRKFIATLQTELDKLTYKYNAVFNAANYAIINKKYKFVEFSPGYAAFMAKLSDTPLQIGKYLTDYLAGDVLEHTTANCDRCFKGETLIMERELQFADGVSTWWLVEYTPACNDKHKINGLIVKVKDITTIKSNNPL